MNTLHFTGQARRQGDGIDTDAILPARYLNLTSPHELGAHCFEQYDPGFRARVRPGDILVAGSNFGCGSSREHAPLAIQACGISCVVAVSFARIFFRNAINLGLPVFALEAAHDIAEGDQLRIDGETGRIINLSRTEEYATPLLPPFMREMLSDGGLVPHIARLRA